MTINLESGNLVLRLWFIMHRIADVLRNGEDRVFGEYEITTEQYAVLAAIKYLGDSVKVSDLAQGLERTPNSVSMIVDRMVKVGLVTRKRDRADRRVVYVTATSKGKNALKLATLPGLKFIGEMLSPLSYEDRLTLLNLLGTVKYKTLSYLNPGVDIEEMNRNDITKQADLVKRLTQGLLPSTPQAKRRGGKKKRAV